MELTKLVLESVRQGKKKVKIELKVEVMFSSYMARG